MRGGAVAAVVHDVDAMADSMQRAPRWPLVMWLGIVAPLVIVYLVAAPSSATHWALIPMLVGWGNSVAAAAIAGIALAVRLLGSQPLATSRVPSRLAVVQGIALFVMGVAASEVRDSPTLFAVGGMTLVVAGAFRRSAPRSLGVDLLLLAACFTIFEVARETTGMRIHVGSGDVQVEVWVDTNRTCRLAELPQPLKVNTLRLTGRIGERIQIPSRRGMEGTSLDWWGHLELGGVSCYLPFKRHASLHEVRLHAHGSTRSFDPKIDSSCEFEAEVVMNVEASWTGSSSCRDLEKRVADKLSPILAEKSLEIVKAQQR